MRGTRLEKKGSYQSNGVIKQVRVTPNGRFAVVHVGCGSYEIVDVSDPEHLERVKVERGWGGLVYYRQLCNGFIDGRYICGTWCAGRTFMTDLGGNEPKSLPDPTGIMPDMECGGYCACGQYALVTRNGGYSVYKPLLEGEYDRDIPVHRLQGGVTFRGKPTVRNNVFAACNRIDGDVTIADISDLTAPKLLQQFTVSGNPDVPFIGEDFVLIPAGYQGLIRFDLAFRKDSRTLPRSDHSR